MRPDATPPPVAPQRKSGCRAYRIGMSMRREPARKPAATVIAGVRPARPAVGPGSLRRRTGVHRQDRGERRAPSHHYRERSPMRTSALPTIILRRYGAALLLALLALLPA